MESERKKKKKRKSREHDINEDEVVHKVPDSGNKFRKTMGTESVEEKSESNHPKAKKKRKHVDTNKTLELETDHLREVNRDKEQELEEDNSHKKKKKKEKKLQSDSEMVIPGNRNTDKISSVTNVNAKPKTGSNKSGTENKLMKKLADLTGKSLIGVKHKQHTDLQGLPEEPLTKKTKNVFKMEDADKVEGEVDEEIDPEKEAIRKKKREKRRLKKLEKQRKKEEELTRFGTGKDSARAYLRQWDTDRDNWRFQKVRQVWLLQNMFNESLVSK